MGEKDLRAVNCQTLKVAIEATHMTQREVAGFLEVRPDTVNHALRGKMQVPEQWLVKLRNLAFQQKAAAEARLKDWRHQGGEGTLSVTRSSNDDEARAAGWPCLSAETGMLANIWTALPEGTKLIVEAKAS